MKAHTVREIKDELATLKPSQLLELSLKLAKFKKENKELLSYLLFEASDEEKYIRQVKEEMASLFKEMNSTNLYLTKKSLRKILRIANRFIRYSGLPETEIEIRVFYCELFRESRKDIFSGKVLKNIYDNQLVKINTALEKLHEDLKFDYKEKVDELMRK
jgi:hypothetical protein